MLHGYAGSYTSRSAQGYPLYQRRLRDADRPDRRVGEGDRRSEAADTEAAHATETILVVDDDPAVRRMIARLLLDDGYAVVEASDGVEALEQCAHHPVAVAVADVRMPRMGGYEFGRRLAKEWPRIRLLLVTGYPGELVEQPDRMLVKPFRPDEFVAIVRSLVASYWRSAPYGDA
jgi:CheY-like chemotaxis protein